MSPMTGNLLSGRRGEALVCPWQVWKTTDG